MTNVKWPFRIFATTYAGAWILHLVTATYALRGFFGDGALAFLINLSGTYVFGGTSRIVTLFSVGFPRDFHLLLNSLGLQAALILGITDPLILKYIFVFWLFALPGLLYLFLFFLLFKFNKITWAIFPLMGWAVVSVPVDWNAINSIRWAMPIFWMHFFLVAFANSHIKRSSALAAVMLSLAMLGGLYETVVLQAGLCLLLGLIIWKREGNKIPLLYASAAVPGALRALWSFVSLGHLASNGFAGFLLPHVFLQPYFLLMLSTPGFCAYFALKKTPMLYFHEQFYAAIGAIGTLAILIFLGRPPDVWLQISPMRFDYNAWTLILMCLAGVWRVFFKNAPLFAVAPAALALFTGSIFWIVQSQQTFGWQSCRARYTAANEDNDLTVTSSLMNLLSPNPHVHYSDMRSFNDCLWDWATPWTDLVTSPSKNISHWSLYTFWQDFSFIQKNGTLFLHTNNWTLTSPAMLESSADLPLKTMLYDLTPLYNKIGLGPFVTRLYCLPPEVSNFDWRATLLAIDDSKRKSMFVCPRTNLLQKP